MAESISMTNASDDIVALEELRKEFSQEGDEQALLKWLELIEKVTQLKNQLYQTELSREENSEIETLLNLAERHLDFRRPYTIAVIGEKGAGKSALINMIFGEYLLPSRDSAEAVTGTVVKVSRRSVADHKESRKTGKVYYDEADLINYIEQECKKHEVIPVFANNSSAPQRLDTDSTLRAVEKRLAANTHARGEARADNALTDLISVLKAMKQHGGLLAEGGETFDLDKGGMLEEFHNHIDEKTDDRSGFVCQTTLVDHAEIDFFSGAVGGDEIVNVDIIDIPGTGISNTRHRKIIQRQLDHQKLDAIILVVAKGTRFGPDTREIIPTITSVIMDDISVERRLDFAERIFLVVNKDDHIYDEQQLNIDLVNLSEKICHGFWERYGKQNIFRLMADAGFIGKLMAAHPEEGARWLKGQSVSSFPTSLMGKGDQWYKTISKFPADCQAKETYSEKFLCGSGAQALLTRLNLFLRSTRFQRDLNQANIRYRLAGSHFYNALARKFETILKRTPSSQPLTDFQSFQAQLRSDFGSQMMEDVERLQKRFEQVWRSLSNDEDTLRVFVSKTKSMMETVIEKVKARTASASFQLDLLNGGGVNTSEDIIFYPLWTKGALPPLKSLDLCILGWFYDESQSLCETMVQELKRHITNCDAMELLDRLSGIWDRADEFRGRLNEKITSTLLTQYTNACRGFIIGRLLEFQVLTEITTGNKEKGSTYGAVEKQVNDKQMNEADRLKKEIDEKYTAAFSNLETAVNKWFLPVLPFLITQDAKAEMKKIATELSVALIQELGDERTSLYKRFFTVKSSEISRAQKLAQDMENLKQFRPTVHEVM
ncbi:MAG: dynamin family protein [Blastocatellia bacterium]